MFYQALYHAHSEQIPSEITLRKHHVGVQFGSQSVSFCFMTQGTILIPPKSHLRPLQMKELAQFFSDFQTPSVQWSSQTCHDELGFRIRPAVQFSTGSRNQWKNCRLFICPYLSLLNFQLQIVNHKILMQTKVFLFVFFP